MKKLKLKELAVKSFVTTQAITDLLTIKAGIVGNARTINSDGPPTTSSVITFNFHTCNKTDTCII